MHIEHDCANLRLLLCLMYFECYWVLTGCTAYHCAYVGDVLFQGILYVTENWFCFHSKLLGKKSVSL